MSLGQTKGLWRSDWLSYALYVPVLAIFLGALIFALAQSSTLERDMRIAATQNMLWVVSQTQMEIYALALSVSAPDRDEDAIARRYDLAISRLNLIQQGPQARYLETLGHLDGIERMTAALLDLDPQRRGHTARLHDALADLCADLHPQINRIANDVMIADWDKAAARLDTYRDTQRLVMVSVTFSLLAALAITWLLLSKQRQLFHAEVQTLRASRLLKQEQDTASTYRDFAAIVSHQLRTPLTLIDSAMHRLERLGDDVSASEVSRRRAVVSGAIGRLVRLSDTVLLLARIDNSQIGVRFEPLHMADIARTLVAEAQAQHHVRRIDLSCAEGPLVAWGDGDLVGHIIDNLLSNALKFSAPDKPVEMRVFAQGQQIACAVSDQGPGITEVDQPYVFDRYYRGQPYVEGVGLGLALAQSLARLQGGHINLETWPGKGSVFTLWLDAAPSGSRSQRSDN